MAKVLKSKRGATTSYSLPSGETYTFLAGADHAACGGMELIKNDEHAKALLAKYGDELTAVPEKDWPARYKKNVVETGKAVMQEAAKKFPELVGQVLKADEKKDEKKTEEK